MIDEGRIYFTDGLALYVSAGFLPKVDFVSPVVKGNFLSSQSSDQ